MLEIILVRVGGWVGGTHSDYKAKPVQLQLQLSTGTELCNNKFLIEIDSYDIRRILLNSLRMTVWKTLVFYSTCNKTMKGQ